MKYLIIKPFGDSFHFNSSLCVSTRIPARYDSSDLHMLTQYRSDIPRAVSKFLGKPPLRSTHAPRRQRALGKESRRGDLGAVCEALAAH